MNSISYLHYHTAGEVGTDLSTMSINPSNSLRVTIIQDWHTQHSAWTSFLQGICHSIRPVKPARSRTGRYRPTTNPVQHEHHQTQVIYDWQPPNSHCFSVQKMPQSGCVFFTKCLNSSKCFWQIMVSDSVPDTIDYKGTATRNKYSTTQYHIRKKCKRLG